jgi:hypothetical protein
MVLKERYAQLVKYGNLFQIFQPIQLTGLRKEVGTAGAKNATAGKQG